MHIDFYQNMALVGNKKKTILACFILAIWVNIPALSAKNLPQASSQPTVYCGEAGFSYFGETQPNCSDRHLVSELTARRNMTKPIFIFREYITEDLVTSGRHDAKSMSSGEITDQDFIQDNENFLTRSVNRLVSFFMHNKYSRH